MAHILEPASSGRSKCRGCGRAIARDELRLGERLPNPFADGEMTLWFHPVCAAYKRPEPLLEALAATQHTPVRDELERIARRTLEHRRLPRIDGGEHAPTGQAKCRSCHAPIERGSWRIRLVFFQDGRFTPGGFLHLTCRQAYFETNDIADRVLHFSSGLDDAARADLQRALADGTVPVTAMPG
jgi:hypothetical protein